MAARGYTVLPQVIDGLVDLFAATLPYGQVIDGESVSADAGTEPVVVVVGMTDPEQVGDVAATGTQGWATLGALARDDRGAVSCSLSAVTGDPDLKAARALAFGALQQLETALKSSLATPWLGVPGLLYGSLDDVTLSQALNPSEAYGAIAVLTFTVTYRARI